MSLQEIQIATGVDIDAVLASVSNESPLKPAANAIQLGRPPDEEFVWREACRLIQDTRARHNDRLAAIWLLASLRRTQEVATWYEWLIRSEHLHGQQWTRSLRARYSAAICLLVLLAPLSLLYPQVMVTEMSVFAVIAYRRLARDKRQNEIRALAAACLGEIAVQESLNMLVAAAFDPIGRLNIRASNWRVVRSGACVGLRRLLPKLTDDMCGRLEPETTPLLCRLLGTVFVNEEQQCRLIDAIALVGDSRAIPRIRSIALREPNAAIKACAERALAILLERERSAVSFGTLLRPADTPNDSIQLLRSTPPIADDRHYELLRSAPNDRV